MTRKVTIDLITVDHINREYVLYLVEDGPWDDEELEARLQTLQDRVYDAVAAAIDGHLASKYPESKGTHIRIQVDCHGDVPQDVEELVSALHEFVQDHPEYQRDIQAKGFVSGIRIVTRRQMGRGDGPDEGESDT